MRDHVRSLVDRPSTQRLTNPELTTFLNRAQLRVGFMARVNRERSRTVSVAGQGEYEIVSRAAESLREDTLGIISVIYDKTDLGPGVAVTDLAAIDPDFRDTTDTGTPQRWYRDGRYLGLHPKPDTDGKTIEIHHWSKPAPMTVDTTECELPEVFHDAVAEYAVWYVERHNREPQASATAKMTADLALAQAMAEHTSMHDVGRVDSLQPYGARTGKDSIMNMLPDNYSWAED